MDAECGLLERTRILEVMSSPPVTVDEESGIDVAARRMYEAGVGSVVVVDGEGRLRGILTRRDILYLVATGMARKNPPVRLYMVESVITAGPDEPVSAALMRMREAGVRHIVVTDGSHRPVGVVSMWDIARLLARECLGEG